MNHFSLFFFFFCVACTLSAQDQAQPRRPGRHFFVHAAYSGVGHLAKADVRSSTIFVSSGVSLSQRWYAGAQARLYSRDAEGRTQVHTQMAGPFVRYYAFLKKGWKAGLDAFCLFGNDREVTPGMYERRSGQTLPGASLLADFRLWRGLHLTPAFHYNIRSAWNTNNQWSMGLSWCW